VVKGASGASRRTRDTPSSVASAARLAP
jgi:hypothetical protein